VSDLVLLDEAADAYAKAVALEPNSLERTRTWATRG
jgi:cytochrome c-type biogenesis protein CcmH/NrfG